MNKKSSSRSFSAITLLAFLSLLVLVGSTSSRAEEPDLKVVMEINSITFDVALRGLRSAVEIVDEAKKDGKKIDLKVIVCGPALDRFQIGADSELRSNFEKLTKLSDVHFFACSPTLKRIHVKLQDLFPGFAVASSGAYEVLTLEKSGYLYIKP